MKIFTIQGMDTILMIIFALLGAAIGSFLNVCIDRLPAGKSLSYPPSHCDACQQRLSPLDLIPVFSYLILRGRCRRCNAAIPVRVLLVELGTGLFFAFTFWRYDLSAEFGIIVFYFCVFLIIGIIDFKHQLILNKIVYPVSIVALMIAMAASIARGSFSFSLTSYELPPGIISAVIGGAAGFVLLLIVALISRGGMGFGDVKMAMLIGLVAGFPLVFIALLLGIIIGGVVASVLLISKIKKRKEAIPFGPFLALAAVVVLLWGSDILSWYLNLKYLT